VFAGLLVIAILIAYLTVLFRKPTVSNLKNDQKKVVTQQATTTNIVNAFNTGSYDESLKLANTYLQKHPKDAQALVAKAIILANKGSVEFKENTYGQQALTVANQALKIDPQLPEAYYARGYAYEIQNEFSKAITDYEKALSLNPKEPIFLTQMGHVYDLKGEPEKAKEYYEKALAINPNFSKALVNMGRYELRYGDRNKAKEYFEKSLPNINNNIEKAGVYYSLGMLLLDDNKIEEGYKYMQQAVTMAPKYPQALAGRGWAGMLKMTAKNADLSELKKEGLTFQTVFGDAEEAVKINPNQTMGYLTLARMYLRLPNLAERSLDYYDQALGVVDKDITLMNNDRENFKKAIQEEKNVAEKMLKNVDKFKVAPGKKTGYDYGDKAMEKLKNIFVGREIFAETSGHWWNNCWRTYDNR